jgi:hypothetical protein
MKVKVVPLSEVSGETPLRKGKEEELLKRGKEEELVKILSDQSGVGQEGGDVESEEMGDVRVEPVPRYITSTRRHRSLI